MAKFLCLVACALLVSVSADRNSARDSIGSSSRDNSRDRTTGDFGFDSGRPAGSSRAGSRTSGSSWTDHDAENDFSTPKITAWKDKTVPYEIASDISSNNAAALKRMFQDISDKTCVTFRPKRASDTNILSIKSGNKCSAPLGMNTGSSSAFGSSSRLGSSSVIVSNMVLGQSCFTTKRVGRRVMNLLGIPHETSRPDRDEFVEINFSNLRTGYANNVKQVARSAYLNGVLSIPYDIHSITQYNDDDLAKDHNTWAIRSKSRTTRSQTLGGDTFSTADFDKIKKAYNCPVRFG